MKRFVVIIVSLFFMFTSVAIGAASNVTKKDIKAVTADGFNINAVLTYPKTKDKKDFPTVVLLHSLGYNTQWWGELPNYLTDKGYAVLTIDLRGHGTSIYNSKLMKCSWKNLKNSGYAKYPDDIIAVINKVKEENPKKTFFNNWAIVGADIGGSAGILASAKMEIQPKTIVLISPVVQTKGLYIPVSIASLGNVDFLSITGTDDTMSKSAEEYLRKFAQKEFVTYTSDSKTTGMLMLKNDTQLNRFITEWISEYFN